MGAVVLTGRSPLYHFTMATARGFDQDDVATLLRRVADALDDLGAVDVHDITFHVDWTDDGSWPSMTVYYEVDEDEAGTDDVVPAGVIDVRDAHAVANDTTELPPRVPPSKAPVPSAWGMNVFALDRGDAFIGRAAPPSANGNGNPNGNTIHVAHVDEGERTEPSTALVAARANPFPLRDPEAFDQRALRRLRELWRATSRRRENGRY
jgi:hypothetical protein